MESESKLGVTELSETMLITLWAKSEETMRSDGILKDNKALEIYNMLQYDFSKFKKAKFSQFGTCLRAKIIDEKTKEFFLKHPDAVVIQLGAGIDARYERLQCPLITHWYDLDLSEVINLRRKYLGESERNTYIASSMFEYDWIDKVQSHDKPTLIIIEGVTMYFEPEKMEEFFKTLSFRFKNATVIFDMLAYAAVGRSNMHDSLSKMGKSVEFLWSLLDSKQMEQWSDRIKVEKDIYFSDCDMNYRIPFVFRVLFKFRYFYLRFNQRIVTLHIGD